MENKKNDNVDQGSTLRYFYNTSPSIQNCNHDPIQPSENKGK